MTVAIGNATLHLGDCITVMRAMPNSSVDSIVCDPPYGLEFMGKGWDGADGFRRSLNESDTGRANTFGRMSQKAPEYRAGKLFQEWCEVWAAEALRVLKPGGHLLAFSGSRTYHRMASAIEDAGFEIRDQIMWIYGSGFPKSHNLSGEHQGWGTALKPAHEPICVARKPLTGTVAANVLAHGTGALNIDGCRVHGADAQGGDYTVKRLKPGATLNETGGNWRPEDNDAALFHGNMKPGRWPANLIHDGSPEVLAMFPDAKGQQGRALDDGAASGNAVYGQLRNVTTNPDPRIESETSAARFFYCAKTSRADRNSGLMNSNTPAVARDATMRECEQADWSTRNGNTHPTVKPTDLMAYLCRLVTPTGGIVLDPFMGSGSTGKACVREGFQFIGIDMTPEYFSVAEARISHEIEMVRVSREAEAEALIAMPIQERLFA